MSQAHYVIRTKMASAFEKAVSERVKQAKPVPRDTQRLIRHVLTDLAKGVGTKYDSRLSKKNNKPAESAVEMKEAA